MALIQDCIIPVPPPTSSSLISDCDDFPVRGPSALAIVITFVVATFSASKEQLDQAAQTFHSVKCNPLFFLKMEQALEFIKLLHNGSDFFGNPVAPTLGLQ